MKRENVEGDIVRTNFLESTVLVYTKDNNLRVCTLTQSISVSSTSRTTRQSMLDKDGMVRIRVCVFTWTRKLFTLFLIFLKQTHVLFTLSLHPSPIHLSIKHDCQRLIPLSMRSRADLNTHSWVRKDLCVFLDLLTQKPFCEVLCFRSRFRA